MSRTIHKLSTRRVQTTKKPGRYGDGNGLWLQVTPAGVKSWLFRYTLDGKARAMGLGDRLGTIEAGKLADLVVVRGNPLDDIRNTRNVDMVMKAGTMYQPQELLRSVLGTLGPRGPDEQDAWMPRRRDGNR